MSHPIELIRSINNTPRTGLWYSAGTDQRSENCEVPNNGMITFIKWDSSLGDWKFVTFSEGSAVSAGIMGITS